MQYAIALLGLVAGVAQAQAVTQAISPKSAPPAGCSLNSNGPFTLAKGMNAAKRSLVKRADTITLTIVNGVMQDPTGETAYIASNNQFQFDKPPQAGAIYTSGFSLCPNHTIALGGSAVFYQCKSGNILNIYDSPGESACSPIFLEAVYLPADGETAPAQAAVTSEADGQPVAPTAAVTSIYDHQPQAPSAYVPITSIVDHQPQVAPTPYVPITSIYDHQPQVGTPVSVGYTPTPVESPPAYTGGAASNFGRELAAIAAGAVAVAML